MSYILKALQKSEAERARGQPPDLETRHDQPRRPRRRTTAALLLTLALAANAAVMGYWALQQRSTAPRTTAPAQATQATSTDADTRLGAATTEAPATASRAATQPPAGRPGPGSPTPATPPAEQPTPRHRTEADPGAGQPPRTSAPAGLADGRAEAPGGGASVAAQAGSQRAPQDTTQAPSRSAARDSAAARASRRNPIPVAALPERVQSRLPELRFSTHIYSADASLREVAINGSRYREGERVTRKLRVTRITEQGVVLSFDGWSFRMGLLEDWNY